MVFYNHAYFLHELIGFSSKIVGLRTYQTTGSRGYAVFVRNIFLDFTTDSPNTCCKIHKNMLRPNTEHPFDPLSLIGRFCELLFDFRKWPLISSARPATADDRTFSTNFFPAAFYSVIIVFRPCEFHTDNKNRRQYRGTENCIFFHTICVLQIFLNTASLLLTIQILITEIGKENVRRVQIAGLQIDGLSI